MSPPELIDAALELLLAGGTAGREAVSAAGNPAHDDPRADCRKAWRVGLGWMEGHNPPPTIDDLLPLEMRQKMLDLWLATGTNVLYTQVQDLLGILDEGGAEAVKLVTESLEVSIFDNLEALRAKWEGGSAE